MAEQSELNTTALLAALDESKCMLQKKSDQCEEYQATIEEMDAKYASAKQELEHMTSENAKLKAHICALKQTLNDKNEEILALDADLTNVENEIESLRRRQILSDDDMINLNRSASKECFAARISHKEASDLSHIEYLKESTPSNLESLSPSPTPPRKMYDAILNTHNHQNEVCSDEKEDMDYEHRIRRQIESAYQDRFDSIVDAPRKYESPMLLVLSVAGVLFILCLIIIGVWGKEYLLCDKCDDCEQMFMDRHVDCDHPPIAKLEMQCPM
mmetsp:Transcript_31702/g.51292  ORF Transcript_31702/g.51292 Transcript_31702/m.51292 type:complete len:272 (+) Transcript_31702:30-845(+)